MINACMESSHGLPSHWRIIQRSSTENVCELKIQTQFYATNKKNDVKFNVSTLTCYSLYNELANQHDHIHVLDANFGVCIGIIESSLAHGHD